MRIGTPTRYAAAGMLALVLLVAPAAAQTTTGTPNALQGFSINRDKPVQITSTTLEVRDKEKKATFIGNVLMAQGDTTMKSRTLDVYYEQDSSSSDSKDSKTVLPGATGSQIRLLEARGNVVVTQKDQTATGDTGIYDMRANTVMLIGNVVITQGPQVIRGERLTTDLTTSVSHVEGGVQGLFLPNKAKTGEGKGGDKTADGKSSETKAADTRSDAKPESGRGKDAAKSSKSTGQPLKLN